MKIIDWIFRLLPGAAILLASAPVAAGEFYLLGSGGQSGIDVAQGSIDNELKQAGATGISSTTKEHSSAYKLQLGYQFNRYFAVEGGYVDLGKASYTAKFNQGTALATIKAHGINLALLGALPITESLSVFGKLGLIDATAKIELHTTGVSASVSNTALRPNIGLGATYDFASGAGLRLEYEEFHKLGKATGGTEKVRFLSIGISYRF